MSSAASRSVCTAPGTRAAISAPAMPTGTSAGVWSAIGRRLQPLCRGPRHLIERSRRSLAVVQDAVDRGSAIDIGPAVVGRDDQSTIRNHGYIESIERELQIPVLRVPEQPELMSAVGVGAELGNLGGVVSEQPTGADPGCWRRNTNGHFHRRIYALNSRCDPTFQWWSSRRCRIHSTAVI